MRGNIGGDVAPYDPIAFRLTFSSKTKGSFWFTTVWINEILKKICIFVNPYISPSGPKGFFRGGLRPGLVITLQLFYYQQNIPSLIAL